MLDLWEGRELARRCEGEVSLLADSLHLMSHPEIERELEENNERLYLAIIEEETAAYVMDKARELGFECAVEVTYGYDGDGVPCPWEVTARGVWTEEMRAAVGRLLEDDLGIPPQRQHFEEELP